MTLRLRLVLGLAAVALLLAAPLVLALRALRDAQAAAAKLGSQDVAASLLIGRSRDVVQEISNAESAVLLVPDSPDGPARMARAIRALEISADGLATFQLPGPVAALRSAARRIAEAAPEQAAAMRAQRQALADSISESRIAPAVQDADRALTVAEQAVRDRSGHTADEVRQTVGIASSQSFFLFIAGAAGATAVSVWLTRSVSGPVRELARGMEAVASGRFDHALRVAPARQDEFGALAANFGTMTRRLAELDRLRAEFVSVASHELKTPLNVILGYVGLVGEGLYGPVTPEQQEVLRTVDGQTRHLTRLVQRLLDVSRFRAGAGTIDARPIALAEFLDELERAHRVLARQRHLTFAVVPAATIPKTVRWDADRMQEVLGNLLSNAVKFTPAGGRVTLTVEPAPEFAAGAPARAGGAVRLCVEDSGVGIDPEQLPHIFDKFYQANNQSRASAVGSGLGLAITKQIVEAHGGYIGAESTPDVGTRFVLLMPVDAAPSVEGVAQPVAAPVADVAVAPIHGPDDEPTVPRLPTEGDVGRADAAARPALAATVAMPAADAARREEEARR